MRLNVHRLTAAASIV